MTDKQPPIRPGHPLPYPASAMPPLDDADTDAQQDRASHPWFVWLEPGGSVSRSCCALPQSSHPGLIGELIAPGKVIALDWDDGVHHPITVACPACHGFGRVVPVKITTHASLAATTVAATTDTGQQPCPGYVPTTKTCERCGAAPQEHSHREA